jgi:hypothetical protein
MGAALAGDCLVAETQVAVQYCTHPLTSRKAQCLQSIAHPEVCHSCPPAAAAAAAAAADILGQRLQPVSKQLVADVLPLTTHTRFRVRVVALQTLTPLMHLVSLQEGRHRDKGGGGLCFRSQVPVSDHTIHNLSFFFSLPPLSFSILFA